MPARRRLRWPLLLAVAAVLALAPSGAPPSAVVTVPETTPAFAGDGGVPA